MKIHELKGVEQLDELNFKHAVAAATLGAATMLNHKAEAPDLPVQPISKLQYQQPKLTPDPAIQNAADIIADKYDLDNRFALDIVKLAHKYQKPGFPTAKDLLAVIAVESQFQPNAISGLHKDPAVGLMQVRPKKWNIDPEALKDPETCIQMGADILHKYYKHLHGDKQAALQAYNVGMQNFQQGTEAPNYLHKFERELKKLFSI